MKSKVLQCVSLSTAPINSTHFLVLVSSDYNNYRLSKCEITVTKGVKVFQDSLEIVQRQPVTQSSSSTATADQDPSVRS